MKINAYLVAILTILAISQAHSNPVKKALLQKVEALSNTTVRSILNRNHLLQRPHTINIRRGIAAGTTGTLLLFGYPWRYGHIDAPLTFGGSTLCAYAAGGPVGAGAWAGLVGTAKAAQIAHAICLERTTKK